MTEVFKLGELFSGPGGLALGAHEANKCVQNYRIEHAWASDYDSDTVKTYIENIPGASASTLYHEDIRKLDLTKLPRTDAFAFGFPCNDFSVVGKQKGIDGTFGPLYQYGVDFLNLQSPKWFVAENVGGLRNSNDGATFKLILDKLSRAGEKGGYVIYPHLYKFEEYGVPQKRHRILIVGIRKDIGIEFRVPGPQPYQGKDVSAGNAILNPPIAKDAFNNERTKQSPQVIRRLTYIKPGENAFTADLPEDLRLNVSGAKISQIYRRLEKDKPSYTITGSGGGGTHVYHWSDPRALTNRERARLQTFPDWFRFIGSKESVRKQVGMAVPVDGSRVVFEAILKSFEGIPYPSIEPSLTSYLPQE